MASVCSNLSVEKCPVSTADLRICTMALWSACPVVPKQISGLGRNQGETHMLISISLSFSSTQEWLGWRWVCSNLSIEKCPVSTAYLRIYGSGPSSSDHLWRAGVPWKQPIPEESPAPAQSVLTKFKAPMQVSNFDEALTSTILV